jgi:hypothetical protein
VNTAPYNLEAGNPPLKLRPNYSENLKKHEKEKIMKSRTQKQK